MQRLDEESEVYFNFINSLDSEYTKKTYEYHIQKFLNHYKIDLATFLKLPQKEISILLIKYLVERNLSRSSKNLVFATIRHACEMNDVILNWKKLKKFIKSPKTGNEANGKDRAYTHEEIKKIVDFGDQRIRTAVLILASTGIRIGALRFIRIRDLERFGDLYKITVYSGDDENEYYTFCTPEAAKEIDTYLDFRKRHGEKITGDSFLLARKFNVDSNIQFTGKQYAEHSLEVILGDYIRNSGLREIDHEHPHKRKEVPIFHGFRKFHSTQLVKAGLTTEYRWSLEGHKFKGNDQSYVKISENVKEMLNQYFKAVPLLTISNEERLRFKLEEKITIERTEIENLRQQFNKFKQEVNAMKKRMP
jgi:integrase